MIYFLLDLVQARIKIGYSTNPVGRLEQLEREVGRKLQPLGVAFGALYHEKRLHERFRVPFKRGGHCSEGEWHPILPPLTQYIADVAFPWPPDERLMYAPYVEGLSEDETECFLILGRIVDACDMHDVVLGANWMTPTFRRVMVQPEVQARLRQRLADFLRDQTWIGKYGAKVLRDLDRQMNLLPTWADFLARQEAADAAERKRIAEESEAWIRSLDLSILEPRAREREEYRRQCKDRYAAQAQEREASCQELDRWWAELRARQKAAEAAKAKAAADATAASALGKNHAALTERFAREAQDVTEGLLRGGKRHG